MLISLNRPFNVGDLIELEGRKELVRRVTTRGNKDDTFQSHAKDTEPNNEENLIS